MRAFARLREVIVSNKELALRLDELESRADLMSLQHGTLRTQYPRAVEAGVRCDSRIDDVASNTAKTTDWVRDASREFS